jgi:hypothetical protein
MIIVSQDRDLIINFDNVTVIGIAQNNSKEIDSITVDKEEQYLGEYKTEERAKEVLAEITEFWKNGAMSDYKGFICYEMPKD